MDKVDQPYCQVRHVAGREGLVGLLDGISIPTHR